jgi:hypothetical protein
VNWGHFDTPLKLKPGIDLTQLPAVNEYGMSLVQTNHKIKSPRIQRLKKEWEQTEKETISVEEPKEVDHE